MSDIVTRDSNGQFVPGNPGGPGRPRSAVSRNASTLDGMGVEIGQQIFQMIAEKALAGDLKAAEMLLSRVWPQRRGRPLAVEAREITALPDYVPAASAITNAVLNGEVTPQEGREMSALLRTQCEAIWTVDFERRLSDVEKQNEEKKPPKRSPSGTDKTVSDGFFEGRHDVKL
jgi:hypothetical protein